MKKTLRVSIFVKTRWVFDETLVRRRDITHSLINLHIARKLVNTTKNVAQKLNEKSYISMYFGPYLWFKKNTNFSFFYFVVQDIAILETLVI